MVTRRSIAPLLALLAAACATLGTESAGDQNLPTSNMGPFRALLKSEDLIAAPYVLDSELAHYREPAPLALDSNPASLQVALYAVAIDRTGGALRDAIVRTRADDARSFYGASLSSDGQPEVVLRADQVWEGAGVHSPSLVRIGGQVLLFYAADGGIGLALSKDGVAFQKVPAPVFQRDPTVGWETSTPTGPSVVALDDGLLHLFYAAGVSIGEATSNDGGATWTRLDGDPSTPALDPILEPSAFTPSSPDAATPFDIGQVADPCVAPRLTPGGRVQVRVLYTGYDAPPDAPSRSSAIGFAARYGDQGPLERAVSEVYAVGKHEAAPGYFEWSPGAGAPAAAMLYVQEDEASSPAYPAIAAAVTPATLTFPMPTSAATNP
ncbi:MAG TPA: hypothetical protein VGI39_42990 [Polyangiaceae bacterium]|jgi:hypothetical protein